MSCAEACNVGSDALIGREPLRSSDTAAARSFWAIGRYSDTFHSTKPTIRRFGTYAAEVAGHLTQKTPSLERCRHNPSGAADIVDPRHHAEIPDMAAFRSAFSRSSSSRRLGSSAKGLAAQPRYSVVAAERVSSLKAMFDTLRMLQKNNSPTGSEFRLYFRR